MDTTRTAIGLSQIFDPALAKELVAHFIKIRQDFATKTLERASSGKFVETFVQCLQHIASGTYEQKPNVDDYLNKRAELELKLPDGLRICAARIARAIYTLRNKRNIAHKGQIDPNTADLAFTYHASAWIMAELLRNATGVKMEEAGALIALIQAPVGALVEDVGGVRIVLRRGSVRSELLLLLHSHYPDPVSADLRRRWLKFAKQRSERAIVLRVRRRHRAIVGTKKGGRQRSRLLAGLAIRRMKAAEREDYRRAHSLSQAMEKQFRTSSRWVRRHSCGVAQGSNEP
jgi:hypothetical protein